MITMVWFMLLPIRSRLVMLYQIQLYHIDWYFLLFQIVFFANGLHFLLDNGPLTLAPQHLHKHYLPAKISATGNRCFFSIFSKSFNYSKLAMISANWKSSLIKTYRHSALYDQELNAEVSNGLKEQLSFLDK